MDVNMAQPLMLISLATFSPGSIYLSEHETSRPDDLVWGFLGWPQRVTKHEMLKLLKKTRSPQ